MKARTSNRLNANIKDGDTISESRLVGLFNMAGIEYFGAMDSEDQDALLSFFGLLIEYNINTRNYNCTAL